MRKMFSENQIKNIVNQGIESGEIKGENYLLTGYIFDMDGEQYAINTSIEEYNNEKIYYALVIHITGPDLREFKIDFNTKKVYDDDELELSIDRASIILTNIASGKIALIIEI